MSEPLEYEFAKKEIIISKNGVPWKKVWLIMKRTVGADPKYYFYISNAGWNHHMITCMLAHFSLWHLKIRLGKKSTC